MDVLLQQLISVFQHANVRPLLWGALLIAATLVLSHVMTRGLRHLLNLNSNPLPSSSILINTARVALWVGAGSLVLDICFGIKANALITALGVGGIAISLGFQGTLSNLIGGLIITFMGIVRPGDNVQVGAQSGVVQDMTWRHTTIRDALGQTVIIPNSVIATSPLVHLLPENRVVVPILVRRPSTEEALRAQDLDEISERIAAIAGATARAIAPLSEEPRVLFSEITALGIEGKVIFSVSDPQQKTAAADAVVRAVATLLN